MDQLALLRATTQRLIGTPVDELPRIAGFLASSLANSAAILNGENSKASESAGPLHRLRTRLSALLQDRATSGRLSAAVIIKSLTEVSTPTESTHWETWARGLIGCLNKSDAWEVKRVYLLAATRIFLLTRGSPTLQREITSPLLPSFLTASLAAVKPISSKQNQKQTVVTNPILPTVLRCWNELVQDHAVTFRPFVSRIKSICLSLVSDFASANDLRTLALKLLSSLHLCAPKATSATEWQSTVSSIAQAAHDSLDVLLRGFLEDWTPSDEQLVRKSVKHNYARDPEVGEVDAAGFAPWQGVHRGAMRVMSLLRWASEMLHSQSPSSVIPFGLILDLTARLNSSTAPKAAHTHLRYNAEVGKDEREAVWAWLPTLHVHSLRLLSTMIKVLGQASSPLTVAISEGVFDIFDAESQFESIRSESYKALSCVLHNQPFSELHLDQKSIHQISKACCSDIEVLAGLQDALNTANESTRPATTSSVFSFQVVEAKKQRMTTNPELLAEARKLLCLILEKPSSGFLSHAARTELDRIAILAGDEQAMFVSVMNPPRQKSGQRPLPSILPFYARSKAKQTMDLEAIVRPRMPFVAEVSAKFAPNPGDIQYDADMTVTEENHDDPLLVKEIGHEESRESEMPSDSMSMLSPIQSNPAKRDFQTMENGATAESKGWPLQGIVNGTKKQRSETMDAASVPTKLPEDNAVPLSGMKVGTTSKTLNTLGELSQPMQPFIEEPVIYGKPAESVLEQDDGSDSEIPAIDTTLAFDDEDEDEDDED